MRLYSVILCAVSLSILGYILQNEKTSTIVVTTLDSIIALSGDEGDGEKEDFNDYLKDVYRKVANKTETTKSTPDYRYNPATNQNELVGYWVSVERNCEGDGPIACYPKTTDLRYEEVEKGV